MVYKGMKPAREGTELREITTLRLEGAEREHFREAEEGNLWETSSDKSCSLCAEMQQT